MRSRSNAMSLALYPRPADPMSTPLDSQVTSTNDVLLKITVPKRIGRKRKRDAATSERGEDDGLNGAAVQDLPNADSASPGRTSSLSRQSDPGYLLQSLRDNPERYVVEPVGVIEKSHRYRGEPLRVRCVGGLDGGGQ